MRSRISYKTVCLLTLMTVGVVVHGQELNCNVIVNADQISTQDRGVFKDMEIAFAQFLNSRRWTEDTYQTHERIKCNVSITVDKMPSIGNFAASVQVQSARPIYNSSYESILLNFADRDWTFEYVQSLPLDFNQNAYSSNLTSMLAFYAYIILGLDYDSYSEMGGTPYYQVAQNIVTNATQSGRPGWNSLESMRNRYWLVENLTNQRLRGWREGYYTYHRLGLDIYQEDEETAQKNILQVLRTLRDLRNIDPNAVIIVSFLDAKSDELVDMFTTGNIQTRREAYNLLVEVSPSKRDKYARIIAN